VKKLLIGVIAACALTALSNNVRAEAAPQSPDLGKDVSKTVQKAGDNLDKSMKTFSDGVRKELSSATKNSQTQSKVKDSKAPSADPGKQAAQAVEKAGNQLDSSMKSFSNNVKTQMNKSH
jgi:uncharacterized FlaG/YvyC family protein